MEQALAIVRCKVHQKHKDVLVLIISHSTDSIGSSMNDIVVLQLKRSKLSAHTPVL